MSWQDEFVQVVNETDHEIEWDSMMFAPGQRRTVPYLNMCNSYGDPRSAKGRHQIFMAGNGERGVIQPREVERQRVQSYWAVGYDGKTWDDIPVLTFYTMEGERLYTVADDPYGDLSTPAPPSVAEAEAMQSTIRRQQQQIDQLLEVAGLTRDALPEDKSAADVPPDIPTDDSATNETQSPWAHSEAINE